MFNFQQKFALKEQAGSYWKPHMIEKFKSWSKKVRRLSTGSNYTLIDQVRIGCHPNLKRDIGGYHIPKSHWT